MLPGGHFDSLRAAFAAQFTPERDGFVYRRGQIGPAVPVSEAERDAFVKRYDRALKLAGWGVFLLTIVILGGLEFVADAIGPDARRYGTIGGMGALIVGFCVLVWRERNRPARVLERRGQRDKGFTQADFRRASLIAMPWRFILFAVVVQLGLVVCVAAFEPDPFGRQQWGYYAVAAIGLAVMAAISWFKWRAMRR